MLTIQADGIADLTEIVDDREDESLGEEGGNRINDVAGIPDAHDPKACWLVCGLLLFVVIVALAIIRWRRWI